MTFRRLASIRPRGSDASARSPQPHRAVPVEIRRVHRGRRRRCDGRPRRGPRHRRRVRLRQICGDARGDGPVAAPGGSQRRSHDLRWPRSEVNERARAARNGRPRHRDDLSGADVVAQPLFHRRLPDRRDAEHAFASPSRTAQSPHDRASARGRHPRSRAALTRLSASTLRRHEPAGDDRDGAGLFAKTADRRRADDRARRDDAGADPRSAARA